MDLYPQCSAAVTPQPQQQARGRRGHDVGTTWAQYDTIRTPRTEDEDEDERAIEKHPEENTSTLTTLSLFLSWT